MWKITILNDRHDGSEQIHTEPFVGSQDEAAERAVVLLGRFGGLRADLDRI